MLSSLGPDARDDRARQATAGGYRLADRRPVGDDTTSWPQTPNIPRRILVRDLIRQGDAKAAARAAESMVEFVERQLGLLANRKENPKRRRRTQTCGAQEVDGGRWLDERHWLAWTLDGELVAVEQLEQGSNKGSPLVRRITDEERQQVSACGLLVDQVIKLDKRHSLDRPPVLGYLPHFDLGAALRAALDRARAGEPPSVPVAVVPRPPAVEPRADDRKHRKTRYHPDGNYILFRRPGMNERLAPFFAVLPGAPVPAAFPTRRGALRRLKRLQKLSIPTEGLVVARVLGTVEAQPVFLTGLKLPKLPEELVALVRKEPRIVQPVLRTAWLPRYVESTEGSWVLQPFHNERSVRHAYTRLVMHDLGEHAAFIAPFLAENAVRSSLRQPEWPLSEEGDKLQRLVQKAGRRMPRPWLDQIEYDPGTLGPSWKELPARSFVPPASEQGHWIRAPFEFKAVGGLKPQRHLVELRIDNLAGLLEFVGFRLRFLLIRESPKDAPRWVLPLSAVECLVAGVA